MHIGKAIKNLRVLAGLSQQQLAVTIGKTTALISQVERKGKVNYYTLVQIAKTLDTTPEKIEQYLQSLLTPVKPTANQTGTSAHLPETDMLRFENRLLKEQFLQLKEQVLQLKKIVILLEGKSA